MTLLLNTFPNTQRYLSISMNYYCQLKYHTANIMIEVINAHELPLQIRQNIAMYKISRISFILLVMVMMRRSIFRNGKFQQWHTAQKCHLLKYVAESTSTFVLICHWLKFLIGQLHLC